MVDPNPLDPYHFVGSKKIFDEDQVDRLSLTPFVDYDVFRLKTLAAN